MYGLFNHLFDKANEKTTPIIEWHLWKVSSIYIYITGLIPPEEREDQKAAQSMALCFNTEKRLTTKIDKDDAHFICNCEKAAVDYDIE